MKTIFEIIYSRQGKKISSSDSLEFSQNFVKEFSNVIIPVTHDDFEPLLAVEGTLKHRSDIWLLTNKERLEQLSVDAARNLTQRFTQTSTVDSAFEGMSDDEIVGAIKDRNFQSPAELNAWFDLMSKQYQDTRTTYENYLKFSEPESPKDKDEQDEKSAS